MTYSTHKQNCNCSFCYSLRGGGAGSNSASTHLPETVSKDYTDKRLEQVKQIIYGNAKKGAVTDDLNQIIGFRTGEGLEFENLAKGLAEYIEYVIHQDLEEERERMRGEIKEFRHKHRNLNVSSEFDIAFDNFLSSLDKLTDKDK